MADIADLDTILKMCGIGAQATRTQLIANKGFTSLADLGVMEGNKDVIEMAKPMSSCTAGEGRINLGTAQIKRLQALIWWVRDNQKRGVDLVAAGLTVAEMNEAMIHKSIEKECGSKEASIKDSSKFDPDDFDIHEDAFLNLLAQISGSQKESLCYVVRAEVAPTDFVDDWEEHMFQIPLNGPEYQEDRRAVYRLLKSFLIDTAGWAWIESFNAMENGRGAFWAWANHYNGQGKLSKQTSLAKANVESLHYRNERSMSFENIQNY
jgi:hypothetical protein